MDFSALDAPRPSQNKSQLELERLIRLYHIARFLGDLGATSPHRQRGSQCCMRSGAIHAVGRCGCAPSRREPQADGSAWRCSTLMVLFVMIPFFLFSSRAGRRIRELHERLLELLIMISFIGRA